MNALTRLLIGGDGRITERNMLWNTVGSAVYALASMLLGAAVTRVLGADAGGIFFFAFSTIGQQMFIVAYFGMRPLQITDTAGRHSFGDYRGFRFMTCFAAAAAGLLYAGLFAKSPEARWCIIAIVAYKIFDGFADVYDSEFQRQGRLYLTGKSNAFRTLFSVAVFFAVMLSTRRLIPSCFAAAGAQLVSVFLFCVLPLKEFPGVVRTRNGGSAKALFLESGWLFLSVFLDLYIFAASKYAVNRYMTDADNSYYTTIFIPTSVSNLMANFVIRPVLTGLSADHDRGDGAHFLKTVLKISGLIAALTALGCGAAGLFGIPALSLLVGPEAGAALAPFTRELVIVILGGGFYALMNLLYYVLVILDAQRLIFGIYAANTAAAFLLADRLVSVSGIPGAAAAYCAAMFLLTACFALGACFRFRKAF